jgi:hypothetical protein
MSPTSYQTAPPRTSIIASCERQVKPGTAVSEAATLRAGGYRDRFEVLCSTPLPKRYALDHLRMPKEMKRRSVDYFVA